MQETMAQKPSLEGWKHGEIKATNQSYDFSETFLRGMETKGRRAPDQGLEPQKPSLEGWKLMLVILLGLVAILRNLP